MCLETGHIASLSTSKATDRLPSLPPLEKACVPFSWSARRAEEMICKAIQSGCKDRYQEDPCRCVEIGSELEGSGLAICKIKRDNEDDSWALSATPLKSVRRCPSQRSNTTC